MMMFVLWMCVSDGFLGVVMVFVVRSGSSNDV